jgi:hypothetical protein
VLRLLLASAYADIFLKTEAVKYCLASTSGKTPQAIAAREAVYFKNYRFKGFYSVLNSYQESKFCINSYPV